MLQDARPSWVRYGDIAAIAWVLVAGAIIAWHAFGRGYLNTGTETDFIGGFQREAARFLSGQPMALNFHPPGYAVMLAAVYAVLGDWFASGLLISVAASGVVLIFSYLCYRELLGVPAGLGALTALTASSVFFAYSIQSTSDAYFLALWCVSLYILVLAMRLQRPWQWFLLGMCVASLVLTRTNGIVAIMFALAPLFSGDSMKLRVPRVGILALGFLLPVCAWVYYASVTGSPLMPTKTHANLALTYFSETDRISGDARIPLEAEFSSSFDVLSRDPVRVAKIYVRDLIRLPRQLLVGKPVTWRPIAILGALCTLAFLCSIGSPRLLMVLAPTLLSVFLINMKAYEPRYYLFVLPVLGAGIGRTIAILAERLVGGAQGRIPVTLLTALLGVVGFGLHGHAGFAKAENPEASAQVAEVIAVLEEDTPMDARVVCRKGNAPFHAGRESIRFPQTDDPKDFCAYLEEVSESGAIFVLIGRDELRLRAVISQFLLEKTLPPWVALVGEGHAGGHWRLLRYESRAFCD